MNQALEQNLRLTFYQKLVDYLKVRSSRSLEMAEMGTSAMCVREKDNGILILYFDAELWEPADPGEWGEYVPDELMSDNIGKVEADRFNPAPSYFSEFFANVRRNFRPRKEGVRWYAKPIAMVIPGCLRRVYTPRP